jgi:hypothetical protein
MAYLREGQEANCPKLTTIRFFFPSMDPSVSHARIALSSKLSENPFTILARLFALRAATVSFSPWLFRDFVAETRKRGKGLTRYYQDVGPAPQLDVQDARAPAPWFRAPLGCVVVDGVDVGEVLQGGDRGLLLALTCMVVLGISAVSTTDRSPARDTSRERRRVQGAEGLPSRKCFAECVKITRIERLVQPARALMISGTA